MPPEVTIQDRVSSLPKQWRYHTTDARKWAHNALYEAVQRLVQLPENCSSWNDFLVQSRTAHEYLVADRKIDIVARYESAPGGAKLDTKVSISFVSGGIFLLDLISWVVGPYPYCCALEYVYDFKYNYRFFNSFPDGRRLFRKLLANMVSNMVNHNNRFLIAMVEYRELDIDDKKAYRERSRIPEPVSEPRMQYPWIYEDLCLFNHGPVQELLMFNNNTYNIIHMMEILFDRDVVNRESK